MADRPDPDAEKAARLVSVLTAIRMNLAGGYEDERQPVEIVAAALRSAREAEREKVVAWCQMQSALALRAGQADTTLWFATVAQEIGRGDHRAIREESPGGGGGT